MGLERVAALLRKGLMVVGGVALCLLVALATGNVLLRVTGAPFSGTYEVVSFLGAVVTAAALGFTQRNKDHTVIDLLSEKYPSAVRRAVDTVSHAAGSVFFAIASWRLFLYGSRIAASGELSETLKLPFHPFVYAVAFGFAVLSLTLLLDAFESLFHRERRA